jgi:FAD dependent oxidoreductase
MVPFWSEAVRERLTKVLLQTATTTTTALSSTSSSSSSSNESGTGRLDALKNTNDVDNPSNIQRWNRWNKPEQEIQSRMLTVHTPHSQKRDITTPTTTATTTTTTTVYPFLDVQGRSCQHRQEYQPWWFQPYSSVLQTVACESTGVLTKTNDFGTNSIPKIIVPTRTEQVKRLHNANNIDQSYDVLVVGGGATGCGIALDSSRRGINTALIERGDFGTETSARSTKLIWAGIRYIATAVSKLIRWNNGCHEGFCK